MALLWVEFVKGLRERWFQHKLLPFMVGLFSTLVAVVLISLVSDTNVYFGGGLLEEHGS